MSALWSFNHLFQNRKRFVWFGVTAGLLIAMLLFVFMTYTSPPPPPRISPPPSISPRPVVVKPGGSQVFIDKEDRSVAADENPGKIAGGDNSIFRDPMAAIRRLGGKLAALPKGDIVLDAPQAMKMGDKRKVDANVGINVPMDVLQKKKIVPTTNKL